MWRFFFSLFLDQVFPQSCLLCKKGKHDLCRACAMQIHPDPKWEEIQGVLLWSGMEYHCSIHAQLIRAFKYKGKEYLVEKILKKISIPELKEVDAIIPVPLHKRKLSERGYNQSQRIAQCIQKNLKIHIKIEDKLIRKTYTQSQAKLDKSSRLKNVQNCFVWKGGSLKGKTILIVDDVISTGSTIKACADTLKKHGAEKVIGFGLARGGK